MTKTKSLEDHLHREMNAIKAFDLRHNLLNTLKLEAYDDSAIDNMWVAKLEKEVPGIVTAYSGEHNFATSTPEENRKVVMEALNSGTAIKASIIGAIILLIYKVYRVMTNNKSFAGGGSGGRGSTIYNARRNEELRDAGVKAVEISTRVKENAAVAAENKLNLEDDSQAYRAAERFLNTVELDVNDEQAAENPFTRIEKMNFDILYKNAGELPSYIMEKDQNAFDDVFSFYTTLVGIATGELRGAFDFHVVNQKVAELTDQLLTGSKDQMLKAILNDNGVKGLMDRYSSYVGEHLGRAMEDPELANNKTVGLIRNKLNGVMVEVARSTSLFKNTEPTNNTMTKDEVIDDILRALEGGHESKILKRCEMVGKFNDEFQTLLNDYPRDFGETGSSTIKEKIMADLDRVATRVKDDDSFTPPERTMVLNAVGELKAIYELVQVQILGSIFKFRMNTDKINKFQDLCIESLLDIYDSGVKFITTIEKSEDI